MQSHSGPVNDTWQRRWNDSIGYMRAENLDTEKSHLAMSLTPRSQRMEYGISLTRELLGQIELRALSHGASFFVLKVETPPDEPARGEAKGPGDKDEVFVLNGRYYLVSTRQREANERDIIRGFRTLTVRVMLSQWRVGPADTHLNEHAVDEAMADLARQLVESAS
jgi:hypothetical protein